MSWEHRWAGLNRHIGDRADTGYLRLNRGYLRLLGMRAALLVSGTGVSLMVGLDTPLVGALCFMWTLVMSPIAWGRRAAGFAGERAALRELMKLPRGNILFNELRVPSESSETGELELDFVVVTQRGYVVVEVKHQRGAVKGDLTEPRWSALKRGARAAHLVEFDNPVFQVRRQIHALSRITNAAGTKGRITGVVVFTHPEATLELVGTSDVQVVTLAGLRKVFPSRDVTGAGRRVQAVLEARQLSPVEQDVGALARPSAPDVMRGPPEA